MVAPLKTSLGVVADSAGMSAVLRSHFAIVYRSVQPVDVVIDNITSTFDFVSISYDRVHEILLELDISGAPGPDGVSPRVMNECADLLAFPLALIFERSVAALLKGGSRANMDNF